MPQLWLYAPSYLRGPLPRGVGEMPVDVAEHLFYGALRAYLDLAWEPGSRLRDRVEERARELMTDVPAPYRVEAYLDALASVGSHLLSVANEVERKERDRRRQGRSLCSLLSRRDTLFGLWDRAIREAPFPGSFQPTGEAGAGAPVYSRAVLERGDKELILNEVFGGRWVGSAPADFGGRLCAGAPLPRHRP